MDFWRKTYPTFLTFRFSQPYTLVAETNRISLFLTRALRGFGYKPLTAKPVPLQTHLYTDIQIRIGLRKTLTSSKSITDQDLSLHTKHGILFASIRKVNIALEIQSLVM